MYVYVYDYVCMHLSMYTLISGGPMYVCLVITNTFLFYNQNNGNLKNNIYIYGHYYPLLDVIL